MTQANLVRRHDLLADCSSPALSDLANDTHDRKQRSRNGSSSKTKQRRSFFANLASLVNGFLLSFSSSRITNVGERWGRVQEEKAMGAVPQGPIEMSRFVAFVNERKKKRMLFKGELMVSSLILPCVWIFRWQAFNDGHYRGENN
ncbi:hypothetical protein D918_02026 [Trichuris suis]|nr:hypothetical protein D918_02026 [Trichuris suis]